MQLVARKELRYEGRAFVPGEVLVPQPDERIADRLLRHGLAEEHASGGAVQPPVTAAQQPVVQTTATPCRRLRVVRS